MTEAHKALVRLRDERRYVDMMRVGPPDGWEIDLEPDDVSKVATITRPDGDVRVQATMNGGMGAEIEVAASVPRLPESVWLARSEDTAGHHIEAYGIMCLHAWNARHTEVPDLVDYSTWGDKEQYIYEWGMEQYDVTLKK